MRKLTALNFDWYFRAGFAESDAAENGTDGFERVDIPHSSVMLPLNNFDETSMHVISTYKKTVDIAFAEDEIVKLCFEGVAHFAAVYVNGNLCGTHSGGYTPFVIDITKHAVSGGNLIVVAVDARPGDFAPFGNVIDYLTYGGIYREVGLLIHGQEYIEDLFVFGKNLLSPNPCGAAQITAVTKAQAEYRFVLSRDAEAYETSGHITSAAEAVIPFAVRLWDIDNPVLYTARAELVRGGTVLDAIEIKTGFKVASFTEGGFLLNGKAVKIRGLNRHQSYPYAGYAMPKSAQAEDVRLLKETLGLNAVRTSHYPQSRHFIEECDRIGLMVFEEIPGWQYVGGENWQETSLCSLREMIVRDRSNPSIILWGVRVNESGDYDGFYQRTNRLARELDPTRPTGGVRCFRKSNLLEDVYTFNDFIHTGENQFISEKKDVCADVPYLITEYCGHMFPTKPTDNESRLRAHGKFHADILEAVAADNRVSGSFGWCMSDYNTHKDFGSNDRICYHGVTDIFRLPKPAAYAYAAQGKEDVLYIDGDFSIGENNAGRISDVYIYTNCDYVEMRLNSILISVLKPSRKSSLKHPPIHVDDFVGSLLINCEGMDKKTSDYYRKLIGLQRKYMGNLPKATASKHSAEAIKKAWELFGKYVCNWGGKRQVYTFTGYRNGKEVCTVTKAAQSLKELTVRAEKTVLKTTPTYDTAKITVNATGDSGGLMRLASDAFTVKCGGAVDVIGDNVLSLTGGQRAFWIRSTARSGSGSVTVESPRFGKKTMEFKITE